MTKIVQNGDDNQIRLVNTLADLITIRNYLSSTFSNKVEKSTYQKLDQKLALLDKEIMNLALMMEIPFKTEP